MKKRGIMILLSIAIILTSCSGGTVGIESIEATKYFSTTIDGEYKYFEEDHEDVVSVTRFIDEYLQVENNIDYMDSNMPNKYEYYVSDVAKQYEEMGLYEADKEGLVENEIKSELGAVSYEKVEFFTLYGQKASAVTVKYSEKLTHATEAYLKASSEKLNEENKWKMIFTCVLEDGQWKISKYTLLNEIEE